MSIERSIWDLGPNPVDPQSAFDRAVESSLDLGSSVDECRENGCDYGDRVLVAIHGRPNGKPGRVRLDSIIIEDDGCGMDIVTMLTKFRGAYFNSESHGRTDQAGRNGVGVKTNLQYWKKITVETTTKNPVPKIPQSIGDGYYRVSDLRPGAPDTEVRRMEVTRDGSQMLSFKKCAHDDSFTKVTLSEPLQNHTLDIPQFIRHLSHSFVWLEHPDHELIVQYPSDDGHSIRKKVKPFYDMAVKDDWICHIKGNSHQDMHLLYQLKDGTQQSILIPAYTGTDMDPMDIDIRVMNRNSEAQSPNDFVISVCGAQVYDKGGASTASYIRSLYEFTQASGFESRLMGFIRVTSDHMKRALRHNKSMLDQEDKYVKAFQTYLIESILKPLNVKYVEYTKHLSSGEDQKILDEIAKVFNGVMVKVMERRRQKHEVDPDDPNHKYIPPMHKEYRCNHCGLVWRVPLDREPTYCAQYATDSLKSKLGCKHTDISRNTHAKNDPGEGDIKFDWKDTLGKFIPAEYDPVTHIINLSRFHPSFVTELTGAREREYKITVGVEKGFFAKAIYDSATKNQPVQETYCELLKEWFESRSNKDPIKIKCRRIWREGGIDQNAI